MFLSFKITKSKDGGFFPLSAYDFLLQDSFVSEASHGQPSRQGDIEMGMQAPKSNPDMGMEAFNKQVHYLFATFNLFYVSECSFGQKPIVSLRG